MRKKDARVRPVPAFTAPSSPFAVSYTWENAAWRAGWDELFTLASNAVPVTPEPQCGEECLGTCEAHTAWLAERVRRIDAVCERYRKAAERVIRRACTYEPPDTHYGTESCWTNAARRAVRRLEISA